jgi:hypothetical protein
MYAYIQDVPIREDLYEKIREAIGPEPPDGLVAHVVLRREDGTLRYVDVWESREACDKAFETRIHPAVYGVFKAMNFKPAGEPRREELPAVHVWLGKRQTYWQRFCVAVNGAAQIPF